MNYELYKKEIEKIAYRHRYDAGAMFGTLSAMEATTEYNDLLHNVMSDNNLTDEQIRELSNAIKIKIGQIPKVEEEKVIEAKEEQERFDQAFADAKRRFKNLSFFERIKLNLKGKGPNQIDTSFMDLQEVRGLYKK